MGFPRAGRDRFVFGVVSFSKLGSGGIDHILHAVIIPVTLENARPASFFYRSQRCTVERAYGPWLKSGEWWEQTIWGQEQWDLVARSQDGGLLFCCMIRGVIEDEWQLVALYD